MSALDDLIERYFDRRSAYLDGRENLNDLARDELAKLRASRDGWTKTARTATKRVMELSAENTQLLIELEAFFQATVSVLGDDEHRGRTTERALKLCRDTVYAYITNHPKDGDK